MLQRGNTGRREKNSEQEIGRHPLQYLDYTHLTFQPITSITAAVQGLDHIMHTQ